MQIFLHKKPQIVTLKFFKFSARPINSFLSSLQCHVLVEKAARMGAQSAIQAAKARKASLLLTRPMEELREEHKSGGFLRAHVPSEFQS